MTAAYLLESVDWPQETRRELDALDETINAFWVHVLPARNKLLAHYDKETAVLAKPLGAFREGEDVRFLEAMDRMCNLMHRTAFGVICGDLSLYHRGMRTV